MKRIKYNPMIKNAFDFLLKSEPLLAGNRNIIITLNTKDLKYSISTETNDVLEQGQAVSQQMLRKQAKKAAKRLGVVFEDECRPRVLK